MVWKVRSPNLKFRVFYGMMWGFISSVGFRVQGFGWYLGKASCRWARLGQRRIMAVTYRAGWGDGGRRSRTEEAVDLGGGKDE